MAGVPALESAAGGAEQAALKEAMRRAESAKYRVMKILPAMQSRPATWTASLSQSNKRDGGGADRGSRQSGIADRRSGIGVGKGIGGIRGIPGIAAFQMPCRLRSRKDTTGPPAQTRGMTTSRLLGVLLAMLTVTMVMARTRQAAPAAGGRDYAVAGVVTAAPAEGRVMVAHEEIAGFMPAMTMPFALTPGERAPALKPGDRVRFTLRVDDHGAWANAFDVVGFDTAVAGALDGGRDTPSTRLRKGDVVPDVSLVTQAGEPFTARDLRGHATAVTFIFTRCPMPEFCPLMVKRFQQVQRAIVDEPALGQARLLAVSLDPTFDTPAVLDAYARAMQADAARWQFVTGAPADVQRLTQAFAVHVERNGVLLDHTLATAVLGPDGRVREIWRGNGWKADEVIAALRAASSTE